MNEINKNSKNYIGYEYKELIIESGLVSIYMDGYKNFGWIVDDNQTEIKESGKVIIRLKRDRKIVNKVELTRLQTHFEDCMKQIQALKKSKTNTALMAALTTGIFGTAFIAGSTFAVTHEPRMTELSIVLAIPGFIGWILPYFIYRKIVQKKTEKLNPIIEEKQDEVYEICEKGNRLLI